MRDDKLINDLSLSIQYSEGFIYEKSKSLYKKFKIDELGFNLQIPVNFFYSIIEVTDGIYSLTHDKNVGCINALSRIQYESAVQFLAMLDENYKLNIASYEYHQIKDLISKNEYLLSVNKMYNTDYFKCNQQKWKELLKDQRFKSVKTMLPKNEKYTSWFNVTKGSPKSINQLIKNYFKTSQIIDKRAVNMYYSLLSGNVHNHNVNRLMEETTMLPIRRDDLRDTSVELVIIFMLVSLIRFIDFFENEMGIGTDNKNDIVQFFEECSKRLRRI